MPVWPDKDEALLRQFVDHLKLRCSGEPVRSTLRGFQRFVSRRTSKPRLGEATISAWFASFRMWITSLFGMATSCVLQHW